LYSIYCIYIYERHDANVLFTVSVPRGAQAVLNLLQPFVSQKSGEVTRFYGHNKDEWRREILKTIAPDQLRPQFGGNKGT
jgi:hypothetical protein